MIQHLKNGKIRDSKTGRVIGKITDRNPADDNLSIVQTILNRMERQGDTSGLSFRIGKQLEESTRALQSALSRGDKNGALKEFSNNVRILRRIQGTPGVSEELKGRAGSILQRMGTVEKAIENL